MCNAIITKVHYAKKSYRLCADERYDQSSLRFLLNIEVTYLLTREEKCLKAFSRSKILIGVVTVNCGGAYKFFRKPKLGLWPVKY